MPIVYLCPILAVIDFFPQGPRARERVQDPCVRLQREGKVGADRADGLHNGHRGEEDSCHHDPAAVQEPHQVRPVPPLSLPIVWSDVMSYSFLVKHS